MAENTEPKEQPDVATKAKRHHIDNVPITIENARLSVNFGEPFTQQSSDTFTRPMSVFKSLTIKTDGATTTIDLQGKSELTVKLKGVWGDPKLAFSQAGNICTVKANVKLKAASGQPYVLEAENSALRISKIKVGSTEYRVPESKDEMKVYVTVED